MNIACCGDASANLDCEYKPVSGETYYRIPCSCSNERVVMATTCANNQKLYWAAPENVECDMTDRDRPLFIGWVCANAEETWTEPYWEPCMTVDEDQVLTIDTVQKGYAGTYTCKRNLLNQPTSTLTIGVIVTGRTHL